MVSLSALWLPILLSAVAVFVISAVIHMMLPWHKADQRKLPDEDGVLAALRGLDLAPADYVAPFAENTEQMGSEEYKAKVAQGPQIFLTVFRGASLGPMLVKWFVFTVIVGVFAAYVTGIALGPGANYMDVLRLTSTVTFVGYSMALWIGHIWYYRDLGATVRSTVDGLVYALLTGGIFASLWP